MSKINEALVMMAEQKETFEVNGKKFQVIEVKDAEQPKVNPYQYLIGKWYKCIMSELKYGFVFNEWYPFENPLDNDGVGVFTSEDKGKVGFRNPERWFDLSNPSDTNPDEVKKILVPSEIGIGKMGTTMCLHFGGSQTLFVGINENSYWVGSKRVTQPIQCELIKCERAELKKGDLAFRTNVNEGNFDSLSGYCVIIDKLKYCYIDRGEDVTVGNSIPHHWYKLQPIQ